MNSHVAYKELTVLGSGQLMEKLYETGVMRRINYIENRMEVIKEKIKGLFRYDQKRMEFRNGYVAKFQAVNQYDVQHRELNEYLNDLGILPFVSKLDPSIKKNEDIRDIVERFQIDNGFYIRMTPNALGKCAAQIQEYETIAKDPETLISLYALAKKEHQELERILRKSKSEMLNCRILKQTKKVSTQYGSVSLLAKKPSFDMKAIYEELGEEFLIEYARVDMPKLDEFIAAGFLKDIDNFRTVTKEPQLRFIITTLEKEQKQLEMVNRQFMKTVQAYRELRSS